MKETVKINLAQRLFDLDQDAYEKLRTYLDSIHALFEHSGDEAEEILFDIEQRIAEILSEKLRDNKQVVTLRDVDEVIEMMGTAEDFARDTDTGEEKTSSGQQKQASYDDYSREHRKLYRDIDQNVIGGVCSGLAAYFNTEIIWIRLAFLVLFFINGVGLILYLVLWVITPAAITTAQKLQMKGRPVNIGNIKDSVNDEFTKVKDNFKKYRSSDSYRRTRDNVGEVANTLGSIVLVIVKVILAIVGVGLAVAGLALLLSMVAALAAGGFWHGWNFPDWHIHENLMPFFHSVTLFSLAAFLVIIIPIAAILAGIFRLIFGLKRNSSILAAFGWTIWSLALAFVIITLIMGVNNSSFNTHYKDVKDIYIPQYKTLYLRLEEESLRDDNLEYYSIFGREIIRDDWRDEFLLEPEISIAPSYDETARMEISYASFIPWHDKDNYETYYFTLDDSLLILDNYWRVDEDDLWRLPKVNIKLFLPEQQQVHIDSDFRKVYTKTNHDEQWPSWYYSRKLKMQGDSLVMVK